MEENGEVPHVKCKVCSRIEGREKLLAPKINSLLKHVRRRKTTKEGDCLPMGQFFQNDDCQHMKNKRLHTMRHIDKVLNLVVASVVVESIKKKMQFAMLFHLLTMGKPITGYGNMRILFKYMRIKNLLVFH